MRAEIAWRKLVPTREFLCDWDPDAARGRVGLARAYVRRVLWLLRTGPGRVTGLVSRAPLGSWRHPKLSADAAGALATAAAEVCSSLVEQDTAFPFGEQHTEFPPVPHVAVVLVGHVAPCRTHLYCVEHT